MATRSHISITRAGDPGNSATGNGTPGNHFNMQYDTMCRDPDRSQSVTAPRPYSFRIKSHEINGPPPTSGATPPPASYLNMFKKSYTSCMDLKSYDRKRSGEGDAITASRQGILKSQASTDVSKSQGDDFDPATMEIRSTLFCTVDGDDDDDAAVEEGGGYVHPYTMPTHFRTSASTTSPGVSTSTMARFTGSTWPNAWQKDTALKTVSEYQLPSSEETYCKQSRSYVSKPTPMGKGQCQGQGLGQNIGEGRSFRNQNSRVGIPNRSNQKNETVSQAKKPIRAKRDFEKANTDVSAKDNYTKFCALRSNINGLKKEMMTYFNNKLPIEEPMKGLGFPRDQLLPCSYRIRSDRGSVSGENNPAIPDEEDHHLYNGYVCKRSKIVRRPEPKPRQVNNDRKQNLPSQVSNRSAQNIPTKVSNDCKPNISKLFSHVNNKNLATKVSNGCEHDIPQFINGNNQNIPTHIINSSKQIIPPKASGCNSPNIPTNIRNGSKQIIPPTCGDGINQNIPTKVSNACKQHLPTQVRNGSITNVPTKLRSGSNRIVPTNVCKGSMIAPISKRMVLNDTSDTRIEAPPRHEKVNSYMEQINNDMLDVYSEGDFEPFSKYKLQQPLNPTHLECDDYVCRPPADKNSYQKNTQRDPTQSAHAEQFIYTCKSVEQNTGKDNLEPKPRLKNILIPWLQTVTEKRSGIAFQKGETPTLKVQMEESPKSEVQSEQILKVDRTQSESTLQSESFSVTNSPAENNKESDIQFKPKVDVGNSELSEGQLSVQMFNRDGEYTGSDPNVLKMLEQLPDSPACEIKGGKYNIMDTIIRNGGIFIPENARNSESARKQTQLDKNGAANQSQSYFVPDYMQQMNSPSVFRSQSNINWQSHDENGLDLDFSKYATYHNRTSLTETRRRLQNKKDGLKGVIKPVFGFDNNENKGADFDGSFFKGYIPIKSKTLSKIAPNRNNANVASSLESEAGLALHYTCDDQINSFGSHQLNKNENSNGSRCFSPPKKGRVTSDCLLPQTKRVLSVGNQVVKVDTLLPPEVNPSAAVAGGIDSDINAVESNMGLGRMSKIFNYLKESFPSSTMLFPTPPMVSTSLFGAKDGSNVDTSPSKNNPRSKEQSETHAKESRSTKSGLINRTRFLEMQSKLQPNKAPEYVTNSQKQKALLQKQQGGDGCHGNIAMRKNVTGSCQENNLGAKGSSVDGRRLVSYRHYKPPPTLQRTASSLQRPAFPRQPDDACSLTKVTQRRTQSQAQKRPRYMIVKSSKEEQISAENELDADPNVDQTEGQGVKASPASGVYTVYTPPLAQRSYGKPPTPLTHPHTATHPHTVTHKTPLLATRPWGSNYKESKPSFKNACGINGVSSSVPLLQRAYSPEKGRGSATALVLPQRANSPQKSQGARGTPTLHQLNNNQEKENAGERMVVSNDKPSSPTKTQTRHGSSGGPGGGPRHNNLSQVGSSASVAHASSDGYFHSETEGQEQPDGGDTETITLSEYVIRNLHTSNDCRGRPPFPPMETTNSQDRSRSVLMVKPSCLVRPMSKRSNATPATPMTALQISSADINPNAKQNTKSYAKPNAKPIAKQIAKQIAKPYQNKIDPTNNSSFIKKRVHNIHKETLPTLEAPQITPGIEPWDVEKALSVATKDNPIAAMVGEDNSVSNINEIEHQALTLEVQKANHSPVSDVSVGSEHLVWDLNDEVNTADITAECNDDKKNIHEAKARSQKSFMKALHKESSRKADTGISTNDLRKDISIPDLFEDILLSVDNSLIDHGQTEKNTLLDHGQTGSSTCVSLVQSSIREAEVTFDENNQHAVIFDLVLNENLTATVNEQICIDKKQPLHNTDSSHPPISIVIENKTPHTPLTTECDPNKKEQVYNASEKIGGHLGYFVGSSIETIMDLENTSEDDEIKPTSMARRSNNKQTIPPNSLINPKCNGLNGAISNKPSGVRNHKPSKEGNSNYYETQHERGHIGSPTPTPSQYTNNKIIISRQTSHHGKAINKAKEETRVNVNSHEDLCKPTEMRSQSKQKLANGRLNQHITDIESASSSCSSLEDEYVKAKHDSHGDFWKKIDMKTPTNYQYVNDSFDEESIVEQPSATQWIIPGNTSEQRESVANSHNHVWRNIDMKTPSKTEHIKGSAIEDTIAPILSATQWMRPGIKPEQSEISVNATSSFSTVSRSANTSATDKSYQIRESDGYLLSDEYSNEGYAQHRAQTCPTISKEVAIPLTDTKKVEGETPQGRSFSKWIVDCPIISYAKENPIVRYANDFTKMDAHGNPKTELIGVRRHVKKNYEIVKNRVRRFASADSGGLSRNRSDSKQTGYSKETACLRDEKPETSCHRNIASVPAVKVVEDEETTGVIDTDASFSKTSSQLSMSNTTAYTFSSDDSTGSDEVTHERPSVVVVREMSTRSDPQPKKSESFTERLKGYVTYDENGDPKREVLGLRRNVKKGYSNIKRQLSQGSDSSDVELEGDQIKKSDSFIEAMKNYVTFDEHGDPKKELIGFRRGIKNYITYDKNGDPKQELIGLRRGIKNTCKQIVSAVEEYTSSDFFSSGDEDEILNSTYSKTSVPYTAREATNMKEKGTTEKTKHVISLKRSKHKLSGQRVGDIDDAPYKGDLLPKQKKENSEFKKVILCHSNQNIASTDSDSEQKSNTLSTNKPTASRVYDLISSTLYHKNASKAIGEENDSSSGPESGNEASDEGDSDESYECKSNPSRPDLQTCEGNRSGMTEEVMHVAGAAPACSSSSIKESCSNVNSSVWSSSEDCEYPNTYITPRKNSPRELAHRGVVEPEPGPNPGPEPGPNPGLGPEILSVSDRDVNTSLTTEPCCERDIPQYLEITDLPRLNDVGSAAVTLELDESRSSMFKVHTCIGHPADLSQALSKMYQDQPPGTLPQQPPVVAQHCFNYVGNQILRSPRRAECNGPKTLAMNKSPSVQESLCDLFEKIEKLESDVNDRFGKEALGKEAVRRYAKSLSLRDILNIKPEQLKSQEVKKESNERKPYVLMRPTEPDDNIVDDVTDRKYDFVCTYQNKNGTLVDRKEYTVQKTIPDNNAFLEKNVVVESNERMNDQQVSESSAQGQPKDESETSETTESENEYAFTEEETSRNSSSEYEEEDIPYQSNAHDCGPSDAKKELSFSSSSTMSSEDLEVGQTGSTQVNKPFRYSRVYSDDEEKEFISGRFFIQKMMGRYNDFKNEAMSNNNFAAMHEAMQFFN